jgi:hypothetical protein
VHLRKPRHKDGTRNEGRNLCHDGEMTATTTEISATCISACPRIQPEPLTVRLPTRNRPPMLAHPACKEHLARGRGVVRNPLRNRAERLAEHSRERAASHAAALV